MQVQKKKKKNASWFYLESSLNIIHLWNKPVVSFEGFKCIRLFPQNVSNIPTIVVIQNHPIYLLMVSGSWNISLSFGSTIPSIMDPLRNKVHVYSLAYFNILFKWCLRDFCNEFLEQRCDPKNLEYASNLTYELREKRGTQNVIEGYLSFKHLGCSLTPIYRGFTHNYSSTLLQ